MKSSADDLLASLAHLGGYLPVHTVDGNVDYTQKGDMYWNDLFLAASIAAKIVKKFENTNTSLSDAWITTRDFLGKINRAVEDKIDEFREAIAKFIDETKLNEEEAKTTADIANESAESILNELGLN